MVACKTTLFRYICQCHVTDYLWKLGLTSYIVHYSKDNLEELLESMIKRCMDAQTIEHPFEGPFFGHDQQLHISRKKKDLLWYYKGPELITNGLLQNLIPSERSEKDLHDWQQSTKEAEEIISRLTFPDTSDVVLDLMMGAGTNIKAALNCGSGRKGIGIEINQVTYELARADLASSNTDLASLNI